MRETETEWNQKRLDVQFFFVFCCHPKHANQSTVYMWLLYNAHAHTRYRPFFAMPENFVSMYLDGVWWNGAFAKHLKRFNASACYIVSHFFHFFRYASAFLTLPILHACFSLFSDAILLYHIHVAFCQSFFSCIICTCTGLERLSAVVAVSGGGVCVFFHLVGNFDLNIWSERVPLYWILIVGYQCCRHTAAADRFQLWKVFINTLILLHATHIVKM